MSAAEADLRAALGAHAPGRRAPKPPRPRGLIQRALAPMTDAEWQALEPLPGAGPGQRRRGRPPGNLGRSADAVFWVAAGTELWRALPVDLGRPGTAHRSLRRRARAGLLHWRLQARSRRRICRKSTAVMARPAAIPAHEAPGRAGGLLAGVSAGVCNAQQSIGRWRHK